MKKVRPRLTETESNLHQLKRLYDKKLFNLLILSDTHGWFCDLRTIRCISKIIQNHRFDEVCINGDICDFPTISKHESRLYWDGIMKGYTEVGEVEYTKEQILRPLRLSTNGDIRIRLGNHDERITKPFMLNKNQLAKLAVLYKNYETTQYNEMLGLRDGFIYDPDTVFTYFDMFDTVHGLSLAKNAPEKNITEYMSSGSSGHSHRLGSKYLTNRKKPYVWLESGCTRLIEEVEYFPTGKIADWQNGFVTVHFYMDGDNIRFYAQPNIIIDGRCYFQGVVYDGNV